MVILPDLAGKGFGRKAQILIPLLHITTIYIDINNPLKKFLSARVFILKKVKQ
jgi:hypothetical protein